MSGRIEVHCAYGHNFIWQEHLNPCVVYFDVDQTVLSRIGLVEEAGGARACGPLPGVLFGKNYR